MIIIPAIDISKGKCVRLTQGNFANETVYSDNPVVMAQKWETEGAKMLHIVDLDGAKSGQLVNFQLIKEIIKKINIPIQIGGGVQSEEDIIKMFSTGLKRIILGTMALENELLLKSLIDKYSDKIVVSLDSKNGKLQKRGWLENTEMELIKTAQKLEKLGVRRFIYTNVLRDGMLAQPDYKSIKTFMNSVSTPIIVAGGISSTADIKKLQMMGVEGVIIGKALYEGKFKIREANNVG